MQPQLLQLDPVRLKAGKDKCPVCGKLMRSYCKTLDKRLVGLAEEILIWLKKNNRRTFNPREVFRDEHLKVNDVQKLGYFRIIEKTKDAGWWELTETGYDFLMGDRTLPKEVWVFNRRVVERSDERVSVDTLDPRWQTCRSDYAMDFIPYNYKLTI